MKIGVTEAGDAGLDLSWAQKLENGKVDGAILITKSITNDFIRLALKFKENTIIHATCTGFGGTVIEPMVPDPENQLSQVRKLIRMGYPRDHIIIRIDPIIPTEKGLQKASFVVENTKNDVNRFRISVMDAYPHVKERFMAAGLPLPYGNSFQASPKQFDDVNKWIAKYPDCQFESCSEEKLNCIHQGCLSITDLNLMGLQPDETISADGYQRKGCLCLSCKTELLTHKHRCPHGCLYCYWRN